MKQVEQVIFSHYFSDFTDSFRYELLPEDLLPTDKIVFEQDSDGYYSENNSWDPHSTLKVIRMRDETPEEVAKREERSRLDKEYYKNMRRKNYLELKKEFEDEGI